MGFFLALVLALGVGFLAGAIVGNSWRRGLIAKKIQGQLAFSWLQVARIVLTTSRPWPRPFVRIPAFHPVATCEAPTEVLWRTPVGLYWGRWDELWALKFLFDEFYVRHIYERDPVAVRAGDIVVDAGANIGLFTRLALDRGARTVIAFEPEPGNAACLKASFQRELQSGQVILVEAALWELTTRLQFSLPLTGDHFMGSVVIDASADKIWVPAITLDEALAQLQVERVDFIKMDLGGAQREALAGATHTLAVDRPRMAIATQHFWSDRQVISKTVRRIQPGYQVVMGAVTLYCHCEPVHSEQRKESAEAPTRSASDLPG